MQTAPPSATVPMLQLDGVSISFSREDETREILHRISLDVPTGEFLCIVGASGCGKTTLLRGINGLIPLSEGEVRVHGRKARQADPAMAMVFQQDSLFPWQTVRENVAYGLRLRGVPRNERAARTQRCIDLVKLSGFESYYPYELSGGMRQRTNLARGLAVDPDLLLMDEPFAALDAQTREVMQAELIDVWSQNRKTVIFITHQLDEAVLLGDRVVVLAPHPGRIREIVDINIPRPRTLHTKRSAEFGEYVDHIWGLIEMDVRSSITAVEER
jgi:NitT/TauT family transport system ATP-binding protein